MLYAVSRVNSNASNHVQGLIYFHVVAWRCRRLQTIFCIVAIDCLCGTLVPLRHTPILPKCSAATDRQFSTLTYVLRDQPTRMKALTKGSKLHSSRSAKKQVVHHILCFAGVRVQNNSQLQVLATLWSTSFVKKENTTHSTHIRILLLLSVRDFDFKLSSHKCARIQDRLL